jgi:hypothetical protein
MDPIPETVDVLHRLKETERDPLVLAGLGALTDRVQQLVPSCVGLSIGMAESGLTLTFVSRQSRLSTLDALGYVAGAHEDSPADLPADLEPVGDSLDPLDEEAWRQDSLAEAAVGISSSLTIPLMEGGAAIGSVSFYATDRDALATRKDDLAHLCGAWAEGAVANADLSFSSRLRAATGPAILDDQDRIDQAAGVAAEALGVPFEEARRRMRAASARAGISEANLARLLIDQD